jgi:hypothetical protein
MSKRICFLQSSYKSMDVICLTGLCNRPQWILESEVEIEESE